MDFFSKIDKIFYAEQQSKYGVEKLFPFYYNPEKKDKFYIAIVLLH